MDRCNMLLSADRRPSLAAPFFAACVRGSSSGFGRRGRRSLIGANFACNSCLIADRTIAIRRRGAAVMRTKSGARRGRGPPSPPRTRRPRPSPFVLPDCPSGSERKLSCLVPARSWPGPAWISRRCHRLRRDANDCVD